jgi:predicted transcriptional regulator
MGNYDISWSVWEMISIVAILNALSDDKAFVLYNTIALGQCHDFKTIIKNMGITPHQYYSRILRITKAGLVKRENGKYVITALGRVVYDAVSTIGKALDHYWALKAIESFQSLATIDSKEYISKLIDTLIDDHKIKKILIEA